MWEDLYAELLNKFRWAIASTVAPHSNMSYRESKACARPFAQLIVAAVKLQAEKPDLTISGWIDQQMAGKPLDKIIA